MSLAEQRGADGSAGGISGVMEYASDLFDRGSVEVLAGRLVRMLEAAVAAPEVAIGRLELLSAAERRTILQEWTATERALPGATLPQLFAAQAAATPDAVAVVFAGEGSAMGSWMGGPTGLRIICARSGWERRAWWGCALSARWSWWLRCLASSRPAAAICRSTPSYPAERLAFMLADVGGGGLLITSAGLRDRLARPARGVLELDRRRRRLRRQPKSAPAITLAAAQPRLRHLYLRLHRNPQGRRREYALRSAQPSELDAEAYHLTSGDARPAENAHCSFRRVGVGVLLATDHGCALVVAAPAPHRESHAVLRIRYWPAKM